jgi:hypothetical protein
MIEGERKRFFLRGKKGLKSNNSEAKEEVVDNRKGLNSRVSLMAGKREIDPLKIN